jgi:hypothetical protein
MSQRRSETKYGDLIEGHDFSDPEPEADDTPPAIEVTRHVISIDDRRDAHGYEYGLDWMFSVEDGVITGYYLGHWLEGKTQSDPMLSPSWDEVPSWIKRKLREELNVDELETDLPEHYGEDRR